MSIEKEIDMNVKEKSMMLLLTTTKTYKEIAAEVRKAIPGSKTTEKSIAFYAVDLRKENPKCLDHRKTNKTGTSTSDLIKKYMKK